MDRFVSGSSSTTRTSGFPLVCTRWVENVLACDSIMSRSLPATSEVALSNGRTGAYISRTLLGISDGSARHHLQGRIAGQRSGSTDLRLRFALTGPPSVGDRGAPAGAPAGLRFQPVRGAGVRSRNFERG